MTRTRRVSDSGLLAGISDALLVPTCDANSVGGLATIFRERLKNGATPDKRLKFIAQSGA